MGTIYVANHLELISVRTEFQSDLIRTAASVRLTDLIYHAPRMSSDAISAASFIVRRSDDSAVSDNVYAAAVSRGPGQDHKPFALLSADSRSEGNIFALVARFCANKPVTRVAEIIDIPKEVVLTDIVDVDG